jgi:hypothetical protein
MLHALNPRHQEVTNTSKECRSILDQRLAICFLANVSPAAIYVKPCTFPALQNIFQCCLVSRASEYFRAEPCKLFDGSFTNAYDKILMVVDVFVSLKSPKANSRST